MTFEQIVSLLELSEAKADSLKLYIEEQSKITPEKANDWINEKGSEGYKWFRPLVDREVSKGVDTANGIGVPLMRAGFPIYDRFGYQKRPIVGYRGVELLLYDIANVSPMSVCTIGMERSGGRFAIVWRCIRTMMRRETRF